MPNVIATTKINCFSNPNERAEIPGPGQNLPSPQPRPNNIAPKIRGVLILVFYGRVRLILKNILSRFLVIINAGTVTSKAPPITNANDGSHDPTTSKKTIT